MPGRDRSRSRGSLQVPVLGDQMDDAGKCDALSVLRGRGWLCGRFRPVDSSLCFSLSTRKYPTAPKASANDFLASRGGRTFPEQGGPSGGPTPARTGSLWSLGTRDRGRTADVQTGCAGTDPIARPSRNPASSHPFISGS